MDVLKVDNKKFKISKKFIGYVLATLLLIFVFLSFTAKFERVALSDISTSKVSRGDLTVQVDGYGKLEPKSINRLAPLTKGTVAKVLLKPGAIVKPDSVVLVLANTELEDEVVEAHENLTRAKASYRQIRLNQEKERLEEDTKLAEINSRYKLAAFRNSMYKTIGENGAISKLVMKESQLNEEELEKIIVNHSKRIQKLDQMNKEELSIAEKNVEQLQRRLRSAEERARGLNIVAGIDGVLLSLSAQVGQSIAANQEIGLVGNDKELVAEIHIPQSTANQVHVGQKAIIDTRKDKLNGVVSRVSPIVEENTVVVEVSLPKELPEGVRVQMSVESSIKVDSLVNVFLIDRPISLEPYRKGVLFKVDHSSKVAVPIEVVSGAASARKMQIISGVNENDVVIISDMSSHEKAVKLK